MKEVKFSCGSYEQNQNMANHINAMCNHGNPANTSVWDGCVCIDFEILSREDQDTQTAVIYIISRFKN